jgi:hypothetical protein
MGTGVFLRVMKVRERALSVTGELTRLARMRTDIVTSGLC